MIYIEELQAWAGNKLGEVEFGATKPSTVKLGIAKPGMAKLGIAELSTGQLRVEKPALLNGMIFALLGDILSTLFHDSLNLRESTILGNTHLSMKCQKRFFQSAITKKAKLFD